MPQCGGGGSCTPGHALTLAYRRKMTAATKDCRKEGIAFNSLAMESLGGWQEVVVKKVRKLGATPARHMGQEEGEAISNLFQKLSIQRVKGNAALFIYYLLEFPDCSIDS